TSRIARTCRGTFLGTVTDPAGAVVAGAKGTAKNVNTALERTAQTSADGSYSIPELPIGTYTVTVSQSGLQTSSTTNVAVDVAAERRVDVALKTGEAVTVVGRDVAAGRDHHRHPRDDVHCCTGERPAAKRA